MAPADMRDDSVTPSAPPRAGRREWVGLAVLALPCLLYSMDLTVLHLAVPSLSADLEPSSVQLLWIIDIYGFLVAGSLITMGTLGDRIGRRRLLMIGAALFGVASVLAAFSSSAETLIASRALLGVAGATVAPSTLSLIRNMFLDPGQRTAAISVWISAFSLGGVLGPFIGGALLEFFWWGSVFLIAVPVMVLVLVLGPMLLPEYKDPAAGRLDPLSAALSIGAVLSIIYGLKQTAQDGPSLTATGVVLGGLALGALFVRRQLSLEDPLLDLRLFAKPSFTASVATYGLTILVMFGLFFFLPQYLQLVRGLSPLHAGLWGIPGSIGFVIGSMFTPALGRRWRPALVMAVGYGIAALSYAILLRIDTTTTFVTYLVGSMLLSVGTAPERAAHARRRGARGLMTPWVALLRGINVGGKSVIKMSDLRACFVENGFPDATTYIASGNVLFSAKGSDRAKLARKIEKALHERFANPIAVVLRTDKEMREVVRRAPEGFGSREYRCDVIYLKEPLTAARAMESVTTNEGVDQAWAGKGVLYFARLSARAAQSRLSRLVSQPVYKSMTIRNWNTTTELARRLETWGAG